MKQWRNRANLRTVGGLAAVIVLLSGLLTACTPATVVLSGTVDNVDHNPYPGVPVRVYSDSTETLVAATVTDDSGEFRFRSSKLADGTYRVRFGGADWYGDSTDWVSATPVSATSAAPATVDHTYSEESGNISGHVTASATGDNISDVHVEVLDLSGAVVDEEWTAPDGTWETYDMGPGPYKVRFTASGFARMFNGGVTPPASPAPVEVQAGQTTPGVDAALVDGGEIDVDSGEVPSGAHLIAVVFDATTGNATDAAELGSEGEGGSPSASFGYLLPGTYQVEVIDLNQTVLTWVYGTTSHDVADGAIVTLGAGQDVQLVAGPYQSVQCATLGSHPNLAGADLSNRGYRGCDFSGADLSGANLSGTDLSSADLSGADLRGATIDYDTVFSGATITGADIDGTDLSELSAVDGVVSGGLIGTPTSLQSEARIANGYLVAASVDLTGADLSGQDLEAASMYSATLDGADLSHADLRGADLSYSSLRRTDLTGADLSSDTSMGDGTAGAEFYSADLTDALLDAVTVNAYTEFTRADLTGTSWAGTSLRVVSQLNYVTTGGITAPPTALPAGFKFHLGYFVGPYQQISNADLHGIDLHGVDLTSSRFSHCDLSSADVSGLNLSGRSITTSNLTGADFSDVTVSNATQLGGDRFTGADMAGTNLTPLKAYNFYTVASGGITHPPSALPGGWTLVAGWIIGPYANLNNADFSGVDLTGIDLSTISVDGAKLATATMIGVRSAGVAGTPASLPSGWFVADSHANNERYLAGPHADLTGAVFSELDMSGANLSYSNLTNAKFLYGTNIAGMDLTGATLIGLTSEISGTPASLPTDWVLRTDTSGTGHLLGPGAYVYGSYTSIDFTGADLSGLNLSGATFRSTNLTNVNLDNANLTLATFPYATIQGTSFARANLTSTSFAHATGVAAGGATATYSDTTCPDSTHVTAPSTCVGHGFAS